MRTAKAEGTFPYYELVEKTWWWLAVIPMLVFDCVALQYEKGKSSLLSERDPFIVYARAEK